MDSFILCEQRDLSGLFPKPDELRAWKWVPVPDGGSRLVEAVYRWNPHQMKFVVQNAVQVTSTVNSEANLFNCGIAGEQFCGFYKTGSEALGIIDTLLASPPEFADDYFLARVHYYRALALEDLNRPAEALAEYIAIYEAAPESAWGMLASLHLEKVND